MEGFRDWLAGLTARELVVYAMVGALLIGGGALWYVRSGGPAVGGSEPGVAVEGPMAGPTPRPATVFVHVAGLVRRPGVYELAEGARVAEAIQLAGGAKGKADLTVLNLAAPLVDGQQILVPKQGPDGGIPVAGGAAPGTVGGLVNVNIADAATLDTLPGIGEVMAQRIIDHREQHGPFGSVDDLINVKGIGPVTLEELRPLVTI
jgi:competence protein ComEA